MLNAETPLPQPLPRANTLGIVQRYVPHDKLMDYVRLGWFPLPTLEGHVARAMVGALRLVVRVRAEGAGLK